ncbi:MAG: helix-turn-helix domain-containing protein [Bacteroidota bacterium]
MTREQEFIKQLEVYLDLTFNDFDKTRVLGYLKEYVDGLPEHNSIPLVIEKVIYRNLKVKDIPAQDCNQVFYNPKDILDLVAHSTGINIRLMTGRRREANIVFARHISMYLIRELCNYTLKDVGKIFNRDHTTIISAHSHVITMIETDIESCTKLIGYVKYHLAEQIKQTA